jgi:pimeloyl-ACP methyl ester carboxylesterase
MTSESLAGTRHESAVLFDAGPHKLFGIVTDPTIDPLGATAIVLAAGGTVSTDRNRLGVRLCRHLAGLGFHALRFDYHGTGESDGPTESFRLDEPFSQDLMGAVSWVQASGLGSVVLIGSCFGARTALACAPHIDELEGVVLVAAPVRDYEMGERVATGFSASPKLYVRRALQPRVVKGLLDPRKRRTYGRIARAAWRDLSVGRKDPDGRAEAGASQLFIAGVEQLVHGSVPTLFVHGEDDDLWRDFDRARSGRLGDLIAAGSQSIEVLTLPGEVHGYKSVRIQDAVIEGVGGWLDRLVSPMRTPTG